MANSVDSDQLASEEVNWSGFTLFAKTGHIQVQQDYLRRIDTISREVTHSKLFLLQSEKGSAPVWKGICSSLKGDLL